MENLSKEKVLKNKKLKSKVKPIKRVKFSENNISYCTFYGVKWEGLGVEVLKDVSSALLNLSQLFKSQNIEIKTLLTVGKTEEENTQEISPPTKR